MIIQFLSNFDTIRSVEDISCSTIEEADQCIVRHVINCTKNDLQTIVVCSGDTNVLTVLISVIPLLQEFSLCQVIYRCVIGEKQCIFNFISLQSRQGDNVSRVLPFSYRSVTLPSQVLYKKLTF